MQLHLRERNMTDIVFRILINFGVLRTKSPNQARTCHLIVALYMFYGTNTLPP